MPATVVELPVLATGWRPVRRFIEGGMTAGIGDPQDREMDGILAALLGS